jgi:hypothetical protein
MTNFPEYREPISCWSTSGQEWSVPALITKGWLPEDAIWKRHTIELG